MKKVLTLILLRTILSRVHKESKEESKNLQPKESLYFQIPVKTTLVIQFKSFLTKAHFDIQNLSDQKVYTTIMYKSPGNVRSNEKEAKIPFSTQEGEEFSLKNFVDQDLDEKIFYEMNHEYIQNNNKDPKTDVKPEFDHLFQIKGGIQNINHPYRFFRNLDIYQKYTPWNELSTFCNEIRAGLNTKQGVEELIDFRQEIDQTLKKFVLNKDKKFFINTTKNYQSSHPVITVRLHCIHPIVDQDGIQLNGYRTMQADLQKQHCLIQLINQQQHTLQIYYNKLYPENYETYHKLHPLIKQGSDQTNFQKLRRRSIKRKHN